MDNDFEYEEPTRKDHATTAELARQYWRAVDETYKRLGYTDDDAYDDWRDRSR